MMLKAVGESNAVLVAAAHPAAAQTKKIMEQRFMFVHTLEEARFNRVVSRQSGL